jgi:hypothetical protein
MQRSWLGRKPWMQHVTGSIPLLDFSHHFFSVDFGPQALLLLNTPPDLLSAPHCFIYFYLLIIYLFYF